MLEITQLDGKMLSLFDFFVTFACQRSDLALFHHHF